MANTFELISSVTVGSGGAASIDFTSIPATYTDLVVKASSRSDRSGDTSDNLVISFNGSTTSLSFKRIQGNGASASSSSGSYGYVGTLDASSATSNTFGSAELYIPNYAGSAYKPVSADTVDETNGTTAYTTMVAQLWSNTAAITSINIKPQVGANFVQYSNFYLYGVKNA